MNWCFFPTPYHEFSLGLPGPRSLWIKRDDLNGLAGGGNKTRKLRHYLEHIKEHGFDAIVTEGAPQSNHCRQTAAMGAANGLSVTLVLGGTGSTAPIGNMLLDELLGAQIIHTSSAKRQEVAREAVETLRAQGFHPVRIPVGGSAPIGVEAYAAGVSEWLEQQAKLDWLPDVIVHASSSGGTQAGLALGAARLNLNLKVLGISVDHSLEELRTIVESLIDATESNPEIASRAKDLAVYNADYLGQGYARPGRAEAEAIELVAQRTGILLDPVYSGRAMVGLRDMIASGTFDDQRLVFWHTGGMPSIHAFGRPSTWPTSTDSGDRDE